MYTATNVSRSVRPKEGECSPEYATSLKLVTGQDALSTQCLFTGTAEQSSKGWHAAHGCLSLRRCPFAKFSGQEEFKKGRGAGSLLIMSVISQKKKFEEEVYTRPLPLTSCQEDRLGLDYTVLCLRSLMAGRSFFSLAARSWKEYSERGFSGCPYGDTTTRVSSPVVGRRKCGSVRCSGDEHRHPHSSEVALRCGCRVRSGCPGKLCLVISQFSLL